MNEERLTEFKILQRKTAIRTMIVVDVICGLLLLFALFLGIRYLVNASFLKDYKEEIYEEKKPEFLTHINFPESFLPYYNLGNVYYKNEQYDKAIAAYNHALEKNPIGKRECPVRINATLAMIKKIDFEDLSSQKKLKNAVDQLQAARNVLVADGCATPAVNVWDGHSAEAEQLKREIDQMLAYLHNLQQQQQNQSGDGDQQQSPPQQDSQDQDKNQESGREKEIREKMEDQLGDSMKERQQAENKRSAGENGGNGGDEEGAGSGNPQYKTW